MSPAPLHLLAGDPHHGVTAYARTLAAAAGCATATHPAGLAGTDPLHLHFTERLWGPTPEAAAGFVHELAQRRPLTVTLHDLPQASDGPERRERRVRAFSQVVDAARGVICNSRWERDLLGDFWPAAETAAVIPLAVPAAVDAPGRPSGADPRVGLLGWLYPGKGHAEAIAAAAGLGIGVIALGAVSPGHDADAERLGARALGVPFTITGFLPEAELLGRVREVAVPLAAHAHISASASINLWLSAGRRPLVADSPYTREMDALRPGTLWRYAPADLETVLGEALAEPGRTWLEPEVDLRPGFAEAAAAYRRWWAEVDW